MKCRVIGPKSRQDRWEKIPEEMAKIGLEWEPFYVAEFKEGDDMFKMASQGFVDVLKDIEGDLLVCESDVTFINHPKEIFNSAVLQLPSEWDLFYLGGNIHEKPISYSENLFRIEKGVHCNHAILYSQKGREKFLELYNPDKNTKIDDWLYHIGQRLMNCFICSPMIAFQRPSYSDINKQFVDYYIEFRSHEIEFMK